MAYRLLDPYSLPDPLYHLSVTPLTLPIDISLTCYTVLIIYRLWRVDRANRENGYCSAETKPRKSRLQKIIRAVAESGALYTVTALIVLICQGIKTEVIYPLTAIVSSIIFIIAAFRALNPVLQEIMVVGITFNLIIIRARQRETGDANTSLPAPTISLAFMPYSTRSRTASLQAAQPPENPKNRSPASRPHTPEADRTSGMDNDDNNLGTSTQYSHNHKGP